LNTQQSGPDKEEGNTSKLEQQFNEYKGEAAPQALESFKSTAIRGQKVAFRDSENSSQQTSNVHSQAPTPAFNYRKNSLREIAADP